MGQSHRKWDIDTIFFIMTELLHVAYQKQGSILSKISGNPDGLPR